MKDERGWALISVLWTIAILAVLAAAVQSLSNSSAQRERRALDDAQISAVLDAGIVRAVVGISDPRIAARWRVDGARQEFTLGGQVLHVSVQDELGRIDLNAADSSLLRQLLESAGMPGAPASVLVDRIVDWRSQPDPIRRGDATGDNGENRIAADGLRYRPRHGPFQTVAELRLVTGMAPALFSRIRPALTVYSRHPAIDTNLAPREALLAYYPNQSARVAEMLRARVSPNPNTSDGIRSPPGVLTVDAATGHAFGITVTLARGQKTYAREAVVVLTGSGERPFLVAAIVR